MASSSRVPVAYSASRTLNHILAHSGASTLSTGTLYFFCGKMASGKSTLARQVAKDKASVLICEDALLAELYPGEITDVSSYARLSVRLKSAMRPIVIELLRNGVSVVLDFPANTVRQRRWLKEVVTEAGARYEFHFLDVPDAVCKSRLKLRVKNDPSRQSTDTEQMFDAMSQYFEAPSNEEGLNVAAGVKE